MVKTLRGIAVDSGWRIHCELAVTIKAGDLVMVVRTPHACWQDVAGIPFTVISIINVLPQGASCKMCGADAPGRYVTGYGDWTIPMSWLIKINPLTEPEHLERDEEITV